ncbi:MAG: T9SS type A sorting domain-containing protein [Bacteroidales bacterium]|nr:T9SS type A sorting domain-containing protein [Bacteroidales bacterium]
MDVINVNSDNVQISTAKYNNGIYFVRVLTADAKTTVKKVVVSK